MKTQENGQIDIILYYIYGAYPLDFLLECLTLNMKIILQAQSKGRIRMSVLQTI